MATAKAATAKALLAKFLDAPHSQAAPEESKELCSWLERRLRLLDKQNWFHLPAAVCTWPHTSWATASTATLLCFRNSLSALLHNLLEPLVEEISDAEHSWLKELHEILGSIVGAIVKKILPDLTAATEMKVTVQATTAAAAVCVELSAQSNAWLTQAQAKVEAATVARSVLEHLGM
jgi:hypothetical protein